MKHVHSLRFETLEARQLLSRAHVHAAVAHAARPVATPVVLNGTLTVDNNPNATTTTTNEDGSITTSVPVAGQLGALGEVHGIWDETVDSFGDYEGPDTPTLHDSKGTFAIAFNNENSPRADVKVRGAVSYEHPQIIYGGTGAYARASESGSIELTTN
ncbi:MAG: hypothetical protein ACXWNX_04910, partial [Isosphaeraceae bacterium]